ncbi:hypothetical protein BD289DRAFT_428883 [Coniella lustricola]|uniref:Uncharacterized protein n=1 Tax=Coniella lustricola TaxID=2025994 RepID=A0A2T3ADN5_9PEZI|nr:hypothetical protein BD289DRAFT_428883 [Coniella lustricola]
MKMFIHSLPILALAALQMATRASAFPSSAAQSQQLRQRDAPQAVSLIFEAGPAAYSLNITADGQEYFTNSDLSINAILAPDYNPNAYCTFTTASGGAVAFEPSLVQRPGIDEFPINELVVGPPQPIVSVTCDGFCLGVYGECVDFQGQYTAPCCNGFCAATRCRPWNDGSA